MINTDLERVKEQSKLLIDAVPIIPIPDLPILCSHPYTNTVVTAGGRDLKKKSLNLTEYEDYQCWRNGLSKLIDRSISPEDILCYVNSAYYLTWFKFVKEYLSAEDFAKLWAFCWVSQENPNADKNVPLRTAISIFRKADKKYFMEPKDYERYSGFENDLVVYRGVGLKRVKNGLSWTTSLQKAEWFAHRFDAYGKQGYVQELVVRDKKNILAYFSTRSEEEVVVDTFREKDCQIIC